MSRFRLAAMGACVVLAAVACGGDPPVVRSVDAVSAGVQKDLAGAGANLAAPSDTTAPTTTPDSAEARLLEGAPALIDGLFDALRVGDFDRASHFTAGPALQLLRSLQTNTACGLGITDASNEKPTNVTVGGKGEYHLSVKSTLTLSTGVHQTFDVVSIEEADDGSWRVFDLLAQGSSIGFYVRPPLAPEREADKLRLALVEACYGPNHVRGTIDLTTSSDFRMQFVDVFLRLPNGDQVRPIDGLGGLTDPIPARSSRQYTFDFQRDGLGPSAALVLVTVDAETKSAGQNRERIYPMSMASIFIDSVSSS